MWALRRHHILCQALETRTLTRFASSGNLVKKLGVIGGGRMSEAFLTAIKHSQKMSDVFVYGEFDD